MNQLLPKFKNPPVVEVALSVQFDRLELSVVQLGTVWQQFRDRFPVIQEKPEIDSTIERFGPTGRNVPGVRFEVGSTPVPRFLFSDVDGIKLVQIQRNRFICNWRKTDDDLDYPSYNNLRKAFVSDWNLFTTFVAKECQSSLVPNQCEVTYVNIIEDVSSDQLSNAVAWIRGSYSDDYLGDLEDAELVLRYVLKNESEQPWGRLHITAAPAIRATDGIPVIRLNATARGAPKAQDTNGVLTTLDMAHEAIVRGFTSVTTTEMHKIWEREA